MDNKIMFRLTYGLFVLTTRNADKLNGCIINTDFRHPWGGDAMRIVQRRRKSRLVIVLLGVIGSLISAGAAVARLIYDIYKDKKQESNPPLQG